MVTQPNQFPQINIRTKMKTDLNRGHFFYIVIIIYIKEIIIIIMIIKNESCAMKL